MSLATQQQNAIVQPRDGEGYEQFIYRAHTELLPRVTDPNARNAMVWGAWERVYGDPLRDRAEQFFPPDQYRTVPNVCYFREHQTKSRDGTALDYNFDKLAELCNNNNDRADTDSYSVIASHHTPHDDDESKKPRSIGFAGPYRLGMIGYQKPVWAIFADEHHLKSETKTFAERPRRSVEVLRFRDGRPSYFDPIATLGVDSPRLNMPVARYEHDAEVERYSVMAPVAVGQSNTYLPSNKPAKEQYGAAPQSQPKQGAPMEMGDLSEQTVNKIVQAVMAIPAIQWATEQMAKPAGQPGSSDGMENTPNDPTQPDELQMDGGMDSAPPPGAPPVVSQSTPSGDMQSAPQPQKPQQYQQPYPQHYSLDEDDMTTDRYSELESAVTELQEGNTELLNQNAKLIKELYSNRAAIENLEKDRVNSERRLRIANLANKFPGFVETDELLEKCLYSEKASMDHDSFEDHIGLVEKYAAKAANTVPVGMIPGGSFNSTPSASMAEKLSAAVIERYTHEANRNIFRDHKVIEAEVRKEMGLAE